MYVDYKSKCLYRQNMTTEEGHEVLSCVHALTWCLPGGTTPITTRTRITVITNFDDVHTPNVITANIELWRETGWIIMEEMFDEKMQFNFISEEDVEKYCLDILELFFTGKLSGEIGSDPDYPPKIKSKRKKEKVKDDNVPKDPIKEALPEADPDFILEKSEPSPDFDWL